MRQKNSENTAALVAIGTELSTGQVVDTNSPFLAEKLTALGFEVVLIQSVPDRSPLILAALGRALEQAALVVTTGGLGPTTDDITRECIAEFAGVKLVRREDSLRRITELFAARGRPCPTINERQADLPESAEVLPNSAGTADGFITPVRGLAGVSVPIISLPGVPFEMKEMFSRSVAPFLLRRCSKLTRTEFRAVRFFGVSESLIGERIEQCGVPPAVAIAYRPALPEVLVKLSLSSGIAESTKKTAVSGRDRGRSDIDLDNLLKQVVTAVGEEFVVSYEPEGSLEKTVSTLLAEAGVTLAVAESCTGGLVADRITSQAGASAYFLGGVVSYSNSAKERLLNVSAKTLSDFGAVSEQTAAQMAAGVRKRFRSDIGISVTGIAGPGGGSADKPVGTVCFGFAHQQGTATVRICYPSERNRFRRYCAAFALDLLRRYLAKLPFPSTV